jgi:hypothetical protein
MTGWKRDMLFLPQSKSVPSAIRTSRPDGVATFSFFAASRRSFQIRSGIRPALGIFCRISGTPNPPLASCVEPDLKYEVEAGAAIHAASGHTEKVRPD